MTVVLSTSPHIKHSAVLEADFRPRNDLMYTFAPLGILMLCATLREKLAITPIIYDINANINADEIKNSDSFYENAAESILRTEPDVLGFMTECDSYHHVLQICKKVKKKKPECFVILGGPHATAVALPTMKRWDCIDAIVLGEGEITFTELIQCVQSGSEKIVAGTVMRDKSGIPVEGDKRELINSLDDLPFPAYDLYVPLPGEELFVEAGRGCPFKCAFCSTSPFWQRKHRTKSAARIVEEIKYIRQFHEVSRVHFTHDLFTTNADWVEEVCHALIQAELGVKWTCSSRIDTISEPLIALMAQAGCNAIFFGIESGSERILKLIDKDIPFETTCEIISICYKYGVSPNGGLILGFPFEDTESFRDTFNAYVQLLKRGMKPLHIFSYCPFAQSSLYKSLGTMECTGNFLDIPLPEKIDMANRQLIKNDRELFGSYFKPVLQPAIAGLKKGMLYAIDEFALLVDAVRIPSLKLADELGGMDNLFFTWVKHISVKNKKQSKSEYRKYFGRPLDYCDFLIMLCQELHESFPAYIKQALQVIRQNFNISLSMSHKEATTMANYRSKTLAGSLTEARVETKIRSENIIAYMRLDYDVSPVLNAITLPDDYAPPKQCTNLLWQKGSTGNVALIQVNDFIYEIVAEQNREGFTVQELIDRWIISKEDKQDVNIDVLLGDLQSALEKEIVTLN
ncbi:MAG TPA: radical SAM protein [Chitinophagaceae bacterium]|nr:radical SAM protein [Chitinophagaceae bacterium]